MAQTYLLTSTDKEDSNFDYHTTNLSSLTFISCGEINCLWEIQFPFFNRTQKATHPSEVNFIHPPPTTAPPIIHQSISVRTRRDSGDLHK